MTLSTRPIAPPTTASVGGSRTFAGMPGLRSSRARTPPTMDLNGRSGAFSTAAGPRTSDAGVHARTHSPLSFTTHAARAPLAHSTTITETATRARQPIRPLPRMVDCHIQRERVTALRGSERPGRVPAGCAVGTPTSLEKPGDGPSVQSGKGGQLDDIHPPLPRLALGHERLPLAEAPRHLHLGQPRLTASLAQAGEEAAVG